MLINADARLIPLADQSVNCVVTSPPYWGLRDYGTATWSGGDPACDHSPSIEEIKRAVMEKSGLGGAHATQEESARSRMMLCHACPECGAARVDRQIGLEPTPEEYVANMVTVMREVWRVLRDDGTLWLNLGDSYAGSGPGWQKDSRSSIPRKWLDECRPGGTAGRPANYISSRQSNGLKPKDLVGIPWRVAFALQADGWYLRSDIIWAKPNPMPESVRDRPTKAHEYIFLLSKSPRYYYDADAIREPARDWGDRDRTNMRNGTTDPRLKHHGLEDGDFSERGRNRRDVWTISTEPYADAHYATFPIALVTPCILAGTSQKGVCPICGKPWKRIMERTGFPEPEYQGDDLEPLRKTNNDADRRRALSGERHAKWKQLHPDREMGWYPTCTHNAEPVSAIVFDPFVGSGTVGEVCRNTQRRFVGLDISLKYLTEQALPRAERKTAPETLNDLPLFTL